MDRDGKDNEPGRSDRWPSGPQVSRGTLISNGVFLAIFVGVAFAMDSFFVLYVAIAICSAVLAVRLARGKSLVPMVAQGNDYHDTYRIDGDRVVVERDGETWSEALSAYDGVLWRSQRVRRGGLAGGRRRHADLFHIVELQHARDRDRNVNIYTSQDPAGMRARWVAAARALGLPALRDTGDGAIRRQAPGDVGRPLRQLAAAGRIDSAFSRASKVPRGAAWRRTCDVLELRLARAVVPQLLVALPFVLFAVFVGMMVPADPWNTVLVILAPSLVYALWVLVSFRLRIDRQRVLQDWRLGPLTLWRRSVPLDAIEEVLVTSSIAAWSAVQVETDRQTLRAAPLATGVAEWSEGFLRAAIADAPGPSPGDR